MAGNYNTYPAVDDEFKFPQPVRKAMADSTEVGDEIDKRLDRKIQAGEFEGFSGIIPDPDDPGFFIPVGNQS